MRRTARRQDGRTARRAAIIVLLAVLPSCRLAAQTRDSVARLAVPQGVQERAVTTARDDDSLVQAIEHQLHCTCGCNLDVFTCRTTDFTCTTSPAMHRAVLALLDSNRTAAQVVTSFEAQYGPTILMEPPKRGFNWSAYLMPFVALLIGVVLLAQWLRRQGGKTAGRHDVDAREPAVLPSGRPADPALERLKHELEHFES